MIARELFLQTTRTRPPHPLEFLVRLDGEAAHFYAEGLTHADFCSVFVREVAPLEVLIYRMPPDLLNPNYWEPLTRENEAAAREKLGGIVTRTENERLLLWRADRVAKGRLLRDGLDAPVDLLGGHVFRTTGAGLAGLGRAWNGSGRLEWAGLRGLPTEVPEEALSQIHADLAQLRLSRPGEVFLLATQDDDAARVLFSRRDHLARAIEALVRGFVHNLTGAPLSGIPRKVCDQLARISDGLGLSAAPERDVLDKGRTIEVHAHLGRTRWGVTPRPGMEPLNGDERVLVYYDRVNGLWAVAT